MKNGGFDLEKTTDAAEKIKVDFSKLLSDETLLSGERVAAYTDAHIRSVLDAPGIEITLIRRNREKVREFVAVESFALAEEGFGYFCRAFVDCARRLRAGKLIRSWQTQMLERHNGWLYVIRFDDGKTRG